MSDHRNLSHYFQPGLRMKQDKKSPIRTVIAFVVTVLIGSVLVWLGWNLGLPAVDRWSALGYGCLVGLFVFVFRVCSRRNVAPSVGASWGDPACQL